MKSRILPIALIILSGILVVLNFILESDMNLGFWMRISSSALLILAMIVTIRAQKQRQ